MVAGSLRLLADAGLAPARSWLQAIEAWVQAGISAGEHAMDLIGRVHGVADVLAVAPAIGRAALLLLPGMLVGILLWAALARFHRRHAAAAASGHSGRVSRTRMIARNDSSAISSPKWPWLPGCRHHA